MHHMHVVVCNPLLNPYWDGYITLLAGLWVVDLSSFGLLMCPGCSVHTEHTASDVAAMHLHTLPWSSIPLHLNLFNPFSHPEALVAPPPGYRKVLQPDFFGGEEGQVVTPD